MYEISLEIMKIFSLPFFHYSGKDRYSDTYFKRFNNLSKGRIANKDNQKYHHWREREKIFT